MLDRHGSVLVRTLLGVDEEQQSFTFAGDLPSGTEVRLMRTPLGELVKGAYDAVKSIAMEEPVLALVVSCVGRRLVLGDRIEEETEAIARHLAPGSEVVGFFSYGERAPSTDATPDLHNQTMTITLWRKDSDVWTP